MDGFIKENKVTLLRLIISVCLATLGICFSNISPVASTLLYVLAYISASCVFIYQAVVKLFKRKLCIGKLLITGATLVAILIGCYFEAYIASMLFLVGELLQSGFSLMSCRFLRNLEESCPSVARLKGQGEARPIEEIQEGEILEVLAGERIPLDGVVVDSAGAVDTSLLTGDDTPRDIKEGTAVLRGYLNLNSAISVKVTRKSGKSAAQRIIDLGKSTSVTKTKSEKFTKQFINIFTLCMVGASLLIAVIPPLFDSFNFVKWIYRAVGVLAVSCPCALIVSVPLAYFCSIMYAAKRGMLVKSFEAFEKLESINTIAFDKTSTLTRPELHVNIVESVGRVSKVDILKYACIAEKQSDHPIALALASEAKRFNFVVPDGENYREIKGHGVECDSIYGHIMAGSRTFVDATTGINIGTVFVSLDGEYLGYIGVGDELKGNSKMAFDRLNRLGVTKRIVMSEDKKSKVDMVARSLGATGAYSHLSAGDKLDAINDIYETVDDCCLAYCGNGVGDVASLERADIGISMDALNYDTAIEKSDVVIMNDNLNKIPLAIRIARNVKRVMVENFILAIVAKTALLALCTFGVIPLYGAVLGDLGVMALSVLNAMRGGR